MASKHYINNREMFNKLCEYLDACKKAKEKDKEFPQVPDYLAQCFLQIAKRLARKPNFSGYSFIEDMKSDGVLDCIKYIKTFKPERSNNPFAFFTQAIKNAFIRRIENEKKQLYIKYKNYKALQLEDDITGMKGIGSKDLNDISNAFIEDFEGRRTKTSKELTNRKKGDKVNANTLTKFFTKETPK